MAINFPNSPTVGDEYTAGGFTWTWTGSAWEKVSATTAAANDFVLLVGATGNTTYVLDRTYTSGRYTIDFVNDDTTYDIYFIAEDGTYAGYTNNAVAVVTADFSEVVVIGAASNETILFTYQGTATAPSTAGDVATAGAYINSVVTSSLPNIDDTTVVNGGNFAANVQVHFIGQDAAVTAAKTVVRTSSTQLVVTRPDSFSTAQSPYTVRVTNPGIPVPAGSNAHLLSNAVTAGTNPVWVTGTTIFYNVGGATSITLLATDTEASDIDYTLVSGTLPAGLTLTEETGVISGTFSGAANEGDVTSITVRATDAGGNFLDRTFSLTANTAPTWTTAAGALDGAPEANAYSYQLVASTGSAGGALTYSLQSGTLPAGLTVNSSGLISGSSSETIGTVSSFTVRVTDALGLFADRAFSIETVSPSDMALIGTYNLGSYGTTFELTGLDGAQYSQYKHLYFVGTIANNGYSGEYVGVMAYNSSLDTSFAISVSSFGGSMGNHSWAVNTGLAPLVGHGGSYLNSLQATAISGLVPNFRSSGWQHVVWMYGFGKSQSSNESRTGFAVSAQRSNGVTDRLRIRQPSSFNSTVSRITIYGVK